jgi:TRAP-type C4-dicarboxylate transport system permease small subunit
MSRPRSRSLLIWIGGGALLVAMMVDTLAMIGRQLQTPLLGAIELVQACVLFASCGALIIAGTDRVHARVHLLLDRLPSTWRRRMHKLHALAAALFYAALLCGSVWMAADLWGGYEESELLRIPYRPLRVAVVLTMLTLLLQALVRLWRREPEQ